MNLKKIIMDKINIFYDLRNKLNENAELSFKEFKTQKIIMNFLKDIDIETKILAKTGVVGTLNKKNNCIAIRADMDALPVNGVSHVCGHDYHMAIVLGAALILKELNINKCIKFIFQPAEESTGGALPMINEGVLTSPFVNCIIGFHVWPFLDVGKIEVSSGASMASVDDFHIKFKGIGGHAATPYKCKNPIYPAMDFIQSMTSKSILEQDPLNPHILTFSSINCGNTPNVIADNSIVKGTVRTFDNKLRKKLQEDILKTAGLSGQKYNCEVDVNYDIQYPPLINDKIFTESFIETSKNLLGDSNVLPLTKTFAAEDFSYFAEKVPSVHFRLGISDNEKGIHPLHSSKFNASDDTLFYGIYVLVNFILSYEC